MSLPFPHSAADSLSRLYQSVPSTQVAAARALSGTVLRLRSDEDAATAARLRHEIATEARHAATSALLTAAQRSVFELAADALSAHRDVEAQTLVARLPLGAVRRLYVGLVDALICGLYVRVADVLEVWSSTGDEGAALRALGCEVMS